MHSAVDHGGDIDTIARIAAVPTILDIVCRTTGMGFAAVARVTEDRWVACGVKDDIAFGLAPGGELAVDTTICNEIRQDNLPVVINRVSDDPVWAAHRTPAMYGFESYISMPILLPDGRFFGTLCAIDPSPARLDTPEIVGMFTMFADLIGFHIDANERLASSQANLLDERRTAELREQFIAVLGHDLRNPLAAMIAGVGLVEKEAQSAKASRTLDLMRRSGERMSALIDNVLDFARGRLGGGLTLHRQAVAIAPLLRQVVAECASANPDRSIVTLCTVEQPVDCDPGRLSQLLSNLVGNAVIHGATDQPIEVTCGITDDHFHLAVTNGGAAIPASARERLFQPFKRGTGTTQDDGLGLGLYIAHEIATAHGGTLGVESTARRTCFTFEMPLAR